MSTATANQEETSANSYKKSGLNIKNIKYSDLVLAFLIIAIISLMILPLPLVVIDTLVALNIALGIILILMSIYINSPLQFSSFPSVLLISTLFRLALSVATTRMILLDGNAGNIIDTFGSLVAGGNIVVGLVVFLIITLVQFLVIAKGSERVAEVGARFTLDAMPGKQMSIDSDLRSGLIDKDEARKKRSDLEKESQLHGSLDGAMKFVKGDAIAGIVIIIVNLLGGLAIGVFQLDMNTSDAMSKYSILTIGDGMVAQIPALFGAMAAGLIVTRVGNDSKEEHLGDAIQQQFTSIPRVSIVAGCMCFLFSFVPGFPTEIFLTLAIFFTITGAMLVPAFRLLVKNYSEPTFDKVMQRKNRPTLPSVEKTESVKSSQIQPLELILPLDAAKYGGDSMILQNIQSCLQGHYEDSGIKLPTLKFRWYKPENTGSENYWALSVFDVPVTTGELSKNIDVEKLTQAALIALRKNIKLFVGIQQTSELLSEASERYPEVVAEVQRAIPLQGISVIIKNLVEEEVPIRNLHAILDALIQSSQQDKDLNNLTEYARMALGRQICHKYARNGVVTAVALSNTLEETLLNSLRSTAGLQELSVSPHVLNQIRIGLTKLIEQHEPSVVIAPVILRRHLRSLLLDDCFTTPVVSYPELTSPFELNIIDRFENNEAESAISKS